MILNLPIVSKVVLLGGGKLLVSLVRWCKSRDLDVSVVTSPRHADESISDAKTLKDFLIDSGTPYIITEKISSKEAFIFLSDLSNAFCLSIGAAWIFKQNLIDSIFEGRLFNIHGTRLPQNRGGGGFSWQIMMGNRLGFCQLHLVDSGVDTGNIVLTEEFLYPASCRIPKDFEEVSFQKTFSLVASFINEIVKNGARLETTPQIEYFSTYWPRLNTAMNAWIDWNDSVESIERFICAFDEPYEGAKTFLNDNKVYIKGVMADFSDPNFHSFQSGIIYRKGPSWILVCALGGSLIIENIHDEKGVSILDSVRVGDRLVTPMSYLDARYKRIIYTPVGTK